MARRFRARGLAALVGLAVAVVPGLGGCDDLDQEAEQPRPLQIEKEFGSAGLAPGQYATPRAITTDGQALYVVDKMARVQRIDPATGACTWWFKMPEYAYGKPTGMRVLPGPEGVPALWVADTHYHRVMIYALPGTGELIPPGAPTCPEASPRLVARFGEYGEGPGQFIYPTDIAVQTAKDGKTIERIYVAEYGGNDRVSVFDASYRFLFSFGALGSAKDKPEFQRPQGIVIVDGAKGREVLVTDSVNHRVGRFSMDGQLLGWHGQSPADPPEPSRAPGRFNHPRGIVDLGDGTVMLAEYGSSRLQRIDAATGESLGVWGQPGRKSGQMAQPWSLTVIGQTVFALDTGNNRIEAFAAPKLRR